MSISIPNIAGFLHNLAATTPIMTRVLFGAMYVAGFCFLFGGVYKLKHYGDIRTMMSSSAELRGPILYLFVGACLVFYPHIITIGLNTVYGKNEILSYTPQNVSPIYNQMFQDIGYLLRLVGFVAFFKGLMMLTRLSNHSSPPGTFGKALTHIIGGLLAVNLFGTWDILKSTIGL